MRLLVGESFIKSTDTIISPLYVNLIAFPNRLRRIYFILWISPIKIGQTFGSIYTYRLFPSFSATSLINNTYYLTFSTKSKGINSSFIFPDYNFEKSKISFIKRISYYDVLNIICIISKSYLFSTFFNKSSLNPQIALRGVLNS